MINELSKGEKIQAVWLNKVAKGINSNLPITAGAGISVLNAGNGCVVSIATPTMPTYQKKLPMGQFQGQCLVMTTDLQLGFDFIRATL